MSILLKIFQWIAGAKRKLADDYDAAQARGEVKSVGKPNSSGLKELAGATDIGLTHKDIHEALIIRDAADDRAVAQLAINRARRSAREPAAFNERRLGFVVDIGGALHAETADGRLLGPFDSYLEAAAALSVPPP